MKFVEIKFASGVSLWFEIPAGMTRQQAIDFFLAPGRFEAEGIGNINNFGPLVDAIPEDATLQPRFPGLDFTGADGGGGGGDGAEELPFDFEGAFPGAAFQRGLETRTGRTGQATNLLQRILGAEAGQTQSAFRGSAIADLLGGTGIGEVLGRSFEDFTAGTGRAARSNLAQDIFRRIGGARNSIESFLGNEALGDAPREFLRPTTAGNASNAIDLLRDALRGTVNPLLLGALPSTTQLFDQFRASPGVGLNPTGGRNIIDFLRNKFRTSQLGF